MIIAFAIGWHRSSLHRACHDPGARFRSARALPFGAAIGQLRWLGKISLAGFAGDNQAL
jgi:hypothetical protein